MWLRYSSGNAPLAKAIKQPSWQQITDHRTKKRQRPRHMYVQERTKSQGRKVGTGVAPWRPRRVRHCRSRIIQAITWTTLCKHHWKYYGEVDSEAQQHWKNKKIMQWVGQTYPSRGRRTRINRIGLVKKESKTGAYRYRHDGCGDTPGWCYTFHLDAVNRSVYIYEIMIMSRKERELDRLKMNFKGATNEAPTCAVPMHTPQTNSLWRKAGEVSSAIELGCWRRVQSPTKYHVKMLIRHDHTFSKTGTAIIHCKLYMAAYQGGVVIFFLSLAVYMAAYQGGVVIFFLSLVV